MTTLALIGLGSNLGDRQAHLDFALASLASETPGVVLRTVSRIHETAPMGGPKGQGAFLNAAAAVETTLEPLDFLKALQTLETQAGRVRTVRWGERPLDLDLLLFGDLVIDPGPVFSGKTIALQVPHPRMALRRFVLVPLAEIAPEALDPTTGRTVASLLANLDRRPSYVTICDLGPKRTDDLCRRLGAALPGASLDSGGGKNRWGRMQRARSVFSKSLYKGKFFSLFDHYSRELRIDRWPVEVWGDRWLVTDQWFDAFAAWAPLSGNDWSQFWERFLAVRDQIIAPTFVVAPQGSSGFSRWSNDVHWPAPLGSVPILAIESNDPEAIASQVLTACASTRTG